MKRLRVVHLPTGLEARVTSMYSRLYMSEKMEAMNELLGRHARNPAFVAAIEDALGGHPYGRIKRLRTHRVVGTNMPNIYNAEIVGLDKFDDMYRTGVLRGLFITEEG